MVIRAKPQMRMTLVRVALPFWRRLFARELVLGVLGTVQDVALLTRHDAQELLAEGHQATWLPYQEAATETAPAKGPAL